MKITFLGTGTSQGIPVIGCNCSTCLSSNPKDSRLRCAIHVEFKGHSFVVDIGPDFRQQMLQNSINHIDFALLTHEHSDHTAGLDDIRPINFQSEAPLDIYGSSRVLNDIKKRFAYIFEVNPYPGAPRINAIEIDDSLIKRNGFEILPIKILHGSLPITGYRINNVAYLTDVKEIPESEFSKLEHLDVLVISALRRKEHYSHLTLDESIDLINRINPKRAYLIHMSHLLGPMHTWEEELPSNIYGAYDGLQVEVLNKN